jgi:hypothetical protein
MTKKLLCSSFLFENSESRHKKLNTFIKIVFVILAVLFTIALFVDYFGYWAARLLKPFMLSISISFLAALLLGYPFLFKKYKILYANLLLISIIIFAANIWLNSYIFLYEEFGVLGVFIGSILQGVGVIPLAFISLMPYGFSIYLLRLAIYLILFLAAKYSYLYIIGKIDKYGSGQYAGTKE